MPLADLLGTTRLIQFNNVNHLSSVEVRRGVVERQVAIFANSHDANYWIKVTN